MEDSIEKRTKRIKNAVLYLISKEIISEKSSQKDIAQKMGAKNSTNTNYALNGDKRYLTDNFLKRFNNAFDGMFSIDWLLTGKGDMLSCKTYDQINENNESIIMESNWEYGIEQPKINYIKGVPYYNVDFIGGFDLVLNDQTINPEYMIDFQKYNNADCWCNVTGHSMEPEINHGDIIALKKIEDKSFLPLGEVYAIVTTNDMRTIKRLGAGKTEDSYTLIPSNKSPEYSPQQLPARMIRVIFQVLGAVKRF